MRVYPETAMASLDVLIHLRRIDTTTPAVRLGLALAARLEAWTTGIHVVAVAPAAFASPEAVALQVHEAEGMVDEAKARAGW
jgi:NAD(P)-dependent dehydrogenase (short-subunit alcohol dehydrogenase family)